MHHETPAVLLRSYFDKDLDNSTDSDGQDHGSNGHRIRGLLLQQSRQQRTQTIVIGVLNVAAALLVIGSIICDANTARKRNTYRRTRRGFGLLSSIHPTEWFPLITAIAVVIQGSVFIGVQSSALQNTVAEGCRLTAELMWPALWLVAVTIIVFGLETTFRSIRRSGYFIHAKRDALLCLGIIIILVVGFWVSSYLMPTVDVCQGSLLWWTAMYNKIAVALASGFVFTQLLSAAIIAIQLIRTVNIDREERIAATKVVYTLVTYALILIPLIVFYGLMIAHQPNLQASRVAEISINLAGIVNAMVHFFLRANARRLAIRSRAAPWSEKRKIRLFGPNDLHVGNFISPPFVIDNKSHLAEGDHDGPRRPPTWPYYHPPQTTTSKMTLIPAPTAYKVVTTPSSQAPHRFRYSIFPSKAAPARPISWSTVFSSSSDEVIELPSPPFSRGHRRDYSNQSNATIQIGLRLSHAIHESILTADSLGLPLRLSSNPYRERHSSMARQSTESVPLRHGSPVQSPPQVAKSGWRVRRDSSWANQERAHRMMQSLPPVPKLPPAKSQLSILTPPSGESPATLSKSPAWPLPSRTTKSTDSWI